MNAGIYGESTFHTIQRETTMKLQGKSLIVTGKIVNVIGEPHNLFRENL